MPQPVVQVDGRTQLVASMRAAGVNLKDLNAANKAAAEVATPAAVSAAPAVSGRLAGTGRAAGTRAAALIRFGSAAVPYAPVIHFGWSGHNIEPQPWAFQAAQSTEPQWTAVYEQEIEKILDTIKGV